MSHINTPSFHDRADLSDLEADMEPYDTPPPGSSTTLVPLEDTGVKPIVAMGRITRASKRGPERSLPEETSRGKKPKTYKDEDIKVILTSQTQQVALLQELMKEVRGLTSSVDNLRTTVTHKMTTMETKLAVQNDRIQSLQTARRDGFLSTLTLDTTNTTPTSSVPHFVAPLPLPSRTQGTPTSPGESFRSPLDDFGF